MTPIYLRERGLSSGGDEFSGYPKPMDPKDVKARIVGEADEHGRIVLPADVS